MATYTSNGGIKLIATGDESGTWGTSTNSNFDIIDRITNGVGAITLTGTTHTLTTSDGTLSDGMYRVLVLGGSPSGSNTITIAPNDAQKMYVVKNGSGQDAVFSQGSGANVTIANGASGIIYSDGAGSGAAVFDVSGDFGALLASNNLSDLASAVTALSNLGVTAVAAELNYNDITTLGTVQASKTVTADASGNVNFPDGDRIVMGAGSDLSIYHNGSNSLIVDSGTGNLNIQADDFNILNAGGTETKFSASSNGATNLYYDNTRRIHTTSSGANVTGVLATDGITMGDGEIANFGNSNDLQISHNGSDSIIAETGTGNLYIRGSSNIFLQKADASETFIATADDGAVTLYHNNSAKLATSAAGITVTGTINGGDLRGEAWTIGRDSNDYFSVGTTSHKWYLDGAEDMRLENDGDLHVEGNVIAYSTTISDERLKTDIVKIDGALDKVAQLNGYTFTYTADGKKSAGVIAQEVQKVLPSAIIESTLPLKMGDDDQTEYMTVQYDQLMGLMIEAIKELKAEVAELKGK